MPRDLFGRMTRPFAGVGARSRLTVPLSLVAHVIAVAAVIVVPLLASNSLPALRTSLTLEMVTPVAPPPPPPLRRATPPSTSQVPPANPDAAPLDTPDRISEEPAWQREAMVVADDGPDIVHGIERGADLLAPPPVPPPLPRPATVRISHGFSPPTKVHDAPLIYPAIARAARVEGVVIIEATIGVDGAVVDARVLRSVPLLDEAALTAVRQWRYTPTMLDGQPVAVIMTVTVHFRLQ